MDDRLKQRFPGSERAIERLLAESESFSDACRDFVEASHVLDGLDGSTDGVPRANKYRALLAELEKEIQSHLGRSSVVFPKWEKKSL